LLDGFRQSWAEAEGRGSRAKLRLGLTLLLDTLCAAPPEWWAAGASPTPPPGGATPVHTFLQDLRDALRSFRRAPTVTLVTALTVAIGIGATTTMLSVANALLLRPPAGVRDPGRLVTVHALSSDGSSFHSFSNPDSRELQRTESGLSDLAPFSISMSIQTGGDPNYGRMEVSANYSTVEPARRHLLPSEKTPGQAARGGGAEPRDVAAAVCR
jgi:hypothetical protein